MRSVRKRFLLFLGCSSLLLYALSGAPSASIISGSWSDACPCNIPCPCWSKHQSSAQFCTNFHVFKIRSGSYQGIDLARSVFVLANLPRAPRQAPVADTLFVGTADEKKALAIENLVREVFSFSPSRVLLTSIQFRESVKKQELLIHGVLHYKIDFEVQRPLSNEVSENLYPWLSDTKQGIVKSVIYSPKQGEAIEYSNTNALSGTFRVSVRSR